MMLAIRAAEDADLAALSELYWHLDPTNGRSPPDWIAVLFERFSRYPGSAILLGSIDRVPVTTCTLVVVPNLTRGGASYALIENVVTHADYRNRGYGKAILKEAVDRAWTERCYKVMLLTGSKEPSTLGFYQSAGFEQSKTGFQMRRSLS